MTKIYTKRLQSEESAYGARISLYVNIVDSSRTSYFICVDGKRTDAFLSKDRALVVFKEKLQNQQQNDVIVMLESLENQAEAISSNPTRSPSTINFATLGVLLIQDLQKKGRHEKHIDSIRVVSRKVGVAEIPFEQVKFWEWLQESLTKLLDGVSSKSLLRIRITLFKQVLRNSIKSYPIALKKWHQLFNTAILNADSHKSLKDNSVSKVKNRKAFSKDEIEKVFETCKTVEHVCYVTAFLAGGFRSGEVERLSLDKLDPATGLLLMDKVQTKTGNGRMPKPSVALMAVLKFMDGRKWPVIDESVDKRRFRATCATLLLLSNVSLKDISERLGHADLTMVSKHYTKTYPEDYFRSSSVEMYLGVPKALRFDGHVVNENAYDRYVLTKFYQEVSKFLSAEAAKKFKQSCIISSIIEELEEIQAVADF